MLPFTHVLQTKARKENFLKYKNCCWDFCYASQFVLCLPQFNFKLLWQFFLLFIQSMLSVPCESVYDVEVIIIIIVIIFSTPELRMWILIFMQNYFIVNDTATKLCRLLFSVNLVLFWLLFLFFNISHQFGSSVMRKFSI